MSADGTDCSQTVGLHRKQKRWKKNRAGDKVLWQFHCRFLSPNTEWKHPERSWTFDEFERLSAALSVSQSLTWSELSLLYFLCFKFRPNFQRLPHFLFSQFFNEKTALASTSVCSVGPQSSRLLFLFSLFTGSSNLKWQFVFTLTVSGFKVVLFSLWCITLAFEPPRCMFLPSDCTAHMQLFCTFP